MAWWNKTITIPIEAIAAETLPSGSFGSKVKNPRLFMQLIRKPKFLAAIGAVAGGVYLLEKLKDGTATDNELVEIENIITPLSIDQTSEQFEERQRQPSGTFARGQAEEDVWPRGMLEDQYTPSGNIEGAWFRDRLRPEFPYVFPFDQRVGDVPQPVQTPWNIPDETGRYNEPFTQAAQAEIDEDYRKRTTPDVETFEGMPEAPPPLPPTTMGNVLEGAPRPPQRLPTAEMAESGALDFKYPAGDPGIWTGLPGESEQQLILPGETIVTDEEMAAAAQVGEEASTIGQTQEEAEADDYSFSDFFGGLWGAVKESGSLIAEDIVNREGVFAPGTDVKKEDVDPTQIYVDLETGRLSTTGEDPAEVKGSSSPSAKEESKAAGKMAIDQANVERVAQNYGLNPAIRDTLSQIEKNAGILRAASVMMGVKDISSNYRDMSIGQLRLARDIVEDLNEGSKGPWKVWYGPNGEQETRPTRGRDSEPTAGYTDTDPNIARYKDTAQLREIKGLVKAGKPWDAYNLIIQYGLGSSFKDADTNASEMMTMFWREANPNLPLGYTWPKWPSYEKWQLLRSDDPEDADAAFREAHGGFLPLGR